MRLTTKFQIAAKSKHELSGLYRAIFNKISDHKICKLELKNGLQLLRKIEHYMR